MEPFVSLPKGENPLDVDFERAKELIDEKAIADAPIALYKSEGVQKGVGRFGPFIKWNGLFINVSKKYDFDNLSQADIETLIEDKLQKTLIKFCTTGKRKEFWLKSTLGRSVITRKIKIELSKEVDATLTLVEVQEMIAKKTPAKKKHQLKKSS
jgi:DNA topoisomerase-1